MRNLNTRLTKALGIWNYLQLSGCSESVFSFRRFTFCNNSRKFIDHIASKKSIVSYLLLLMQKKVCDAFEDCWIKFSFCAAIVLLKANSRQKVKNTVIYVTPINRSSKRILSIFDKFSRFLKHEPARNSGNPPKVTMHFSQRYFQCTAHNGTNRLKFIGACFILKFDFLSVIMRNCVNICLRFLKT